MWNFLTSFNNIQQFRLGGDTGISVDEDPTFLAFSLDFQFEEAEIPTLHLPSSPLLTTAPAKADVSAESFLRARSFETEAKRLSTFKDLLKDVSVNKPWYFQSIKGLNKLSSNSANMNNAYKAKDVVLEISTLESIDLKISYLASLYNKAVYDATYMRELVPENLRRFQCNIYLAEFRHIMQFEKVTSKDPYDIMEANMNYFKDHATYFNFECYMCEFDFSNSIPSDEYKVFDFDNSASNSFKIKVGMFMEKHMFSFYDIMTHDDFNTHISPLSKQQRSTSNLKTLNGITGAAMVANNTLTNNNNTNQQ